jgi:hypothetical protein
VAHLSHKVLLLIILGLLIIPLVSVCADNASAYNPEPDPYWKTAHSMTNFMTSSGPHFVMVHSMSTEIETRGTAWSEADEMGNAIIISTDPENETIPHWTRAHSFNNRMNTIYHWAKADRFNTTMDTETEWVQVHFIYLDGDTNYTWENVSWSQTTFRSVEPTEPVVPVTPGLFDFDSSGWLLLIIYLMILWLPGMLLGLVAPQYGQIIGILIMGIITTMAFSGFILPLFVILLCAGVVLYRGGR